MNQYKDPFLPPIEEAMVEEEERRTIALDNASRLFQGVASEDSTSRDHVLLIAGQTIGVAMLFEKYLKGEMD